MRAAVVDRYGPPEVVRVVDLPEPAPADGELLVRVRATTVNRTDCALRAADPFIWRLLAGPVRPRCRVIGTEFAGEVVGLGPGVTGFAVGDRVFGFNDKTFGTHAEYMTVAAAGSLARVPEGLGFIDVVAGTEGVHYAMAALRVAKVTAGQAVLVYGATGAIGSAAVQLLREAGVRTTAVSQGSAELVRGLGAERVLDVDDFPAALDGERFDAVIDAVGKSSFGRCRPLLREHGVYVSGDLGAGAQNIWLSLLTPALPGRNVRFPFPRIDAGVVRHLAGLIGSGRFRPVIDRHYPLDHIVDAHRYADSGRKIGNVLIDVPS